MLGLSNKNNQGYHSFSVCFAQVCYIEFLQRSFESGAIILILQMRKLNIREVKKHSQHSTASEWWGPSLEPWESDARACVLKHKIYLYLEYKLPEIRHSWIPDRENTELSIWKMVNQYLVSNYFII